MKKRVLAVVLAVTMCFNMVACGAKDTDVDTSDVEEVVEAVATEEPEEVVEEVATEEPEEVVEEVVEEEPEEEIDFDAEEEEEEIVSLMGYNMIENHDFEAGQDGWSLFLNLGKATLGVEDGALVTDISNLGMEEHGVQIYCDGFGLEQNCVYEIQFDASSTIERTVQYRIQLNGGDYHYYSGEYITLTPETQHYDITFTMEEASDPAPRLCFNMGVIEDAPKDEHIITFDNFDLQCIDESNRIVASSGPKAPKINLNQVGYQPGDSKIAVFSGKDIDLEFDIVDVATGDVVFTGKTSEINKNKNTRKKEAQADFTDFTIPGTYKLVAEKCGESYEFQIADGIYDEAFKAALKMFYMQRCGVELDKKYAGEFAHDNCHMGEATIYGTEDKIDVTGGWHDAGDYGRYVVSGAKAVADLLLAYESYPEVFDDELGIPESGNGVADVLDEARFELEWLLKMQAEDGGVYHKVTGLVFPGIVMPEGETEEMFVSPVSNAATGDFAAVMAMAARIYADVDKEFAKTCLEAAEKSAAYLNKAKSGKGFKNPTDIVTGEYPDAVDTDERLWANAELFKTTGDSKYDKEAQKVLSEDLFGLGWADVGCYGAYAYTTAEGADEEALEIAKAILKAEATTSKENASVDTYMCTLCKDYAWGSNMLVADNGVVLYMTGNDKLAKAQLDYLLGNNGNGYCFLTGFGTVSPISTHHRPSQYLGTTMKGMLVGGPNSNLEDPYAQNVLKDAAPALCYVDNEQSYSCNEITVYWNSPLVYLLAAVEAGR